MTTNQTFVVIVSGFEESYSYSYSDMIDYIAWGNLKKSVYIAVLLVRCAWGSIKNTHIPQFMKNVGVFVIRLYWYIFN